MTSQAAFQYYSALNPADFDKYTPPTGVKLTASQAKTLGEFLELLPHDEKFLLYLWRFVFGVDVRIIRRYAGDIPYANGVIEALRFACKRCLELEKPISNAGMAQAFAPLMPGFEIVLVSARQGICWFSHLPLDPGLVAEALLHHLKQP